MGQDPFCGQIQRTGTGTALVPAQDALLFDAATFAVTDEPDTVATGDGASITGVSRVALRPDAAVTLASLEVGDLAVTTAAAFDDLITVGGDIGAHNTITFSPISAPSTPAAGKVVMWLDSGTGKITWKTSGGTTHTAW